ncbi:MAG: NAD(P)/FAD-dependent oxidoreductase [Gammaproteobacteria bacterium]|nr:NAD(P)/FAD-dependent oxidoreductase [Gammaproteobacteria bacterium]
MCAFTAGRRGRKVLVLDHSKKPGSKILMSGGGRCNFTNLCIESDHYLSANPHYCKSALSRYTQWDFIAMVERHGITFHERDHGQLFCNDSAREILTMLEDECQQAGVELISNCSVETITPSDRFLLQTSRGEFSSETLVIATGGPSVPTMDSSGFGYDVARQFGMSVLPIRAGLVPFMFSNSFKSLSERLSGVAIRAAVSTSDASFTEAVLFTHRGLSGPAILQLSNYWKPGDEIVVNLLPGVDLLDTLLLLKQKNQKSLMHNLLSDYLPRKLVLELEVMFWKEWATRPVGEMSDLILKKVANSLTHWRLKPSATEGYRTAEVTLGGVDTADISSKTMESKTQSGLYFIGEVVDVSGQLGGFNLQWAWSSGYAAGEYV